MSQKKMLVQVGKEKDFSLLETGAKILADDEKQKTQEKEFNLLETVAKSVAPLGEVFTADSVLEGLTSVLAEKLGLGQTSDAAQDAANILTQVIVLETLQGVFNIGSGIKNLNMDSFTLAKILKIVQRIENKVDLILDTPLKIAIENMTSFVNMMEAGENQDALKYLDKIMDKTMDAFEYAKKGKNIEDFKKAIVAKQLLMFAKIMTLSFNKGKNEYLPFYHLPRNEKELIAKELERDSKDVLTLEKKIDTKFLHRFVPGGTKKEKGEIRDLADSILKVAYPYISEGRGWTSLSKTISPNEDQIKLTLDPELLPDGEEDAALVHLGRITPAGGAQMTEEQDNLSNIFTAKIWKKEESVFIASDTTSTQVFKCSPHMEIVFDLTGLPPY